MLSLLLALALQDPPKAKTVEDHLKELEAKLAVLERRSKALADENAQLEKKLADAEAAKENYARQAASAWVKRYAAAAEFTGKQSAEIEELWRGWNRESLPGYWGGTEGAKVEEMAWKRREEALRAKLDAGQAGRLQKKVLEEQEQLARASLGSFVKEAKIAPERAEPFGTTVMARLKFPEGAILLQARPAERVDWFKVLAAVEQSLPDLEKVLAETELTALRATVARWKPQRRP